MEEESDRHPIWLGSFLSLLPECWLLQLNWSFWDISVPIPAEDTARPDPEGEADTSGNKFALLKYAGEIRHILTVQTDIEYSWCKNCPNSAWIPQKQAACSVAGGETDK